MHRSYGQEAATRQMTSRRRQSTTVSYANTAMVSTRLVKNNRSALETLYLVEGLKKILLGKPAMKKLAVVQQCNITAKDAH